MSGCDIKILLNCKENTTYTKQIKKVFLNITNLINETIHVWLGHKTPCLTANKIQYTQNINMVFLNITKDL